MEAGALTEVGARTARLTHSRQRLCRPARIAEVTARAGRVSRSDSHGPCTQRARGRS
jgi:hypothetical protein